MARPYLSTDDMLAAVAAAIQRGVADLEDFWAVRVDQYLVSAANSIFSVLNGRGYSSGLIDGWDQRVEFNRDLCLYFLFRDPFVAQSYRVDDVKAWDRRAELETVTVFVNGSPVPPDLLLSKEVASGVGGGRLAAYDQAGASAPHGVFPRGRRGLP